MPGMDGTGRLFEPLLDALPPEQPRTVLRYPHDPNQTYESLMGQVRTALPHDEPFALIAESFSGPLALRVAEEGPSGLCAVVLSATFVRPPLRLAGRWMAPFVRPAMFAGTPLGIARRRLLGAQSSASLRTLFEESLRAVPPKALAARARAILSVDARSALGQCPVPILYLRGLRDSVVPERALQQIREIRPSVTVAKLDAPHLLLQARPKEAISAIEDFLRSLDQGTA